MSDIKISIVVPCYNVEKYLSRCMNSLVGQTIQDIEIICIDDKSTDGTLDILHDFAKRDSRISVISFPENRGVAVARNIGLQRARGQYVGFIDPDDYIDTDFYEKLYNKIENTKADLVKAAVYVTNAKTNERSLSDLNDRMRDNHKHFTWQFWSALYKHEFLTKHQIEFPAGVITGQDSVFLTHVTLKTDNIQFVDDTFYHYFMFNTGSLDSEYLPKHKSQSKLDMFNRKIQLILDENLSHDRYIDFIKIQIIPTLYYELNKSFESQTDKRKIFDILVGLNNQCEFSECILRTFGKKLYRYIAKGKLFPDAKRKIIWKKRFPDGRRHVYFLGIKILSYNKHHRRQPIPALRKCKYVHIMYNDKFIAPFVDFMNRNFNPDEHLFLCMHIYTQFPFPNGKNVVKIRHLSGIDLSHKNIKQVICHSLFVPGIVEYLYKHQDVLQTKAYWCMWGGDLYNAPRDAVNDFVRKNFYAYIGLIDREYALNKYGMRDNFHGACYIFPTLFGNDDVNVTKQSNPIRIQVNNSADDSTLEMLDVLSKFRDQDIEIYTVLSYGKMEYRDQIIARGTELFGDKFNYLGDYLAPDEYKEFVKKNHILILNQNRQQGVGNTILNIQYGNKVFIRGDVSTYKYLNDVDGVKIFDSRRIGNMTFDEFIRNDYVAQNRKNIRNHTDESVIAQRWRNIFNAK